MGRGPLHERGWPRRLSRTGQRSFRAGLAYYLAWQNGLQIVAAWGGCAPRLHKSSASLKKAGSACTVGGLQVMSGSCLQQCSASCVICPLGLQVTGSACYVRQTETRLTPAPAASLTRTTLTWPAGDVKEFGFRPLPEDGDFSSRFSATETSVAAEKEAQQDGPSTADAAASSPSSSPTKRAAPKEKSASWFGTSEGQM